MSTSRPRLERTGTEPKKALSAYGLRLALAIGAVVVFAGIALWTLLTPGMADASKILGILAAFVAVVALIDIGFIVRGMRREPVGRHRG